MEGAGPIRRFLADDHERLDVLLRSAVTPSGKIDLASYEEFRGGLLRRDHGAPAPFLVPTPTADIVGEICSISATLVMRERNGSTRRRAVPPDFTD